MSVLFGNIAPKGAVIKVGGVDPSIKVFKGKAICFNSHDAAVEAIDNKTVREGHVVVIRYEGPKGGPGMPRNVSSYIIYRRKRFRKRCRFNYGWTFSSYSWYRCRSYFTEAASGGPIGLIRDGDEITIDLVNRTLDVNQPQEELYKRKEELEPKLK